MIEKLQKRKKNFKFFEFNLKTKIKNTNAESKFYNIIYIVYT